MAETSERIALTVVTPKGVKVKAHVDSVQAPGIEGEFGVLPGHLPLLSALKPGVLRYRESGTEQSAAVDIGYIEAGPESVRLLTEGFVATEKVDLAEVQKELDEAEEALKNYTGICEGPEYDEMQRAIAWARARIAISGN